MRVMDKPTPKLIHVFRAGTHVTAAGEKIEFTQADLAAAAAAYAPALHEAPLVVGHPTMDAPAYGWVKGLSVQGNDLYAEPDQVNPEFAEMVASGAFKNRSMKWYRPTDAANPAPGVWYPQHVGFLGATPPAIKGLRAAQFAAADVGVEFMSAAAPRTVSLAGGQWEDLALRAGDAPAEPATVAGLFRRLREWFIGTHGQETADKVIPGYDVDSLAEDAARETPEVIPGPAFAEASTIEEPSVTPEEKAALEAENTRLAGLLATHEASAKATQAAAVKTAAVQFCEGLIGSGQLLPAEKDSAVGLLVLAANAQPVEFGEGDGSVTDAPLPRLEALLKALPKRVEFGEVAGHQKSAAAVEFSAPDNLGVDASRLELHSQAIAYQAAHPGTDYIAAVKAVS